MLKLHVNYQITDPRIGTLWPLPCYATEGSAGLDIRACIDEPLELQPNQQVLISTGISFHVADVNFGLFVFPRSGLSHKHAIGLSNAVGVVDSDYQGTLFLSVWNHGNESFTIQPGERLAQCVFMPVVQAILNPVTSHESTLRGAGGFGHSGRQ